MADYIKELRALVGHRSLILNTSAGALLNDKQELLLQERTGNDDWCFPGGFIVVIFCKWYTKEKYKGDLIKWRLVAVVCQNN